MQQALRKRNQYQRETYQEWKQLPPSLPRPNTVNVAVFLLSFDKLVYINQGSANGEQIQIKLEWWGMNFPHRLSYEASNPCKGKYIVCSSIERLLTYLFDMKLLSVEISAKAKTLGKAYLNFSVLKGWKGEMYEGSLDIKQGSKKIGELDYSISIQNMQNPYVNQFENEAAKANSQINLRVNPPSVQQVVRKTSIRSKQDIFPIIDEIIMPKHRASTSNSHKMYEQERPQAIRPVKNDKFTSTSRLQFPLETHHRHIETNYETEMIRLIEDYNLLFDKSSKSIFPQDNKENSVQIQIVKIQANYKDNVQIQVTVPLIDGNKNYYKLSTGGFVKLQLRKEASQQQLLQYLKQCNMSFRCGQKIEGSIKLSKILARTNQVLEVQLYERQGRKQTKKAKGACFIRAIPPRNNSAIIEPPNKEDRPADVKAQIKQEEYILINLKHYNPIEKNNRLYNLFLKVTNEDQSLGQSKTLWNSKLCCFFDEKLTYKISSNKITFQLYDRQQNLIRLAIGELTLNSPLGVNIEIPLISKHMNMNVVVGYLSFDYFKNGLESVTKMIPILKKEREIGKHEYFEQRQKEVIPKPEPQPITENIIDQQPQNEDNKESNKQDDKENNIDINTQVKKEQPVPIKPKQVKKLSIMEIYNKLFTFLHTNSQFISLLQGKQQHKVTQFLSLFSPIIQKNILTISQLNQLISQYLYSSPQHINKISSTAFIDSYESFSTYYQQLIQQKDELLHTFLLILEGTGMSINDLQHQLRDRKIWSKINLILSNQKSNKINIVEDLKRYYQKKDETFVKYGIFDELTGPQFCDILRKYEVYETCLGSQINEELLCQRVYRNTIELLQQLQPDIELYSYRQLIAFMEQQQIILSQWQLLNLQEYLSKYDQRKTVPKYPNFNQQAQKNQPTISKSPTFGYLHQPQHKPEPLTSENYMVDSLAVKMQNLAISPINYNSNQTIQGNVRAIFSNLTHKIQQMYVNSTRIPLECVDSISPNNYRSNSINQPQHSHTEPIQRQRQKDLSNPSQKPSTPSQQLQSYKSESQDQKSHFQLQLATDIAFSYHVQLQLAQLQEAIQLQCLHGEWCALATEDGEYLGSICIS